MSLKNMGAESLKGFRKSVNSLLEECSIDISPLDVPRRKGLVLFAEQLTKDDGLYKYIGNICKNLEAVSEYIKHLKVQLWAAKQEAKKKEQPATISEDKDHLDSDTYEKDIIKFLENMITLRDKLDMRLDYVTQEESDNATAKKILESQLKSTALLLKKSGVEILDKTGLFDPSFQEVVKTLTADDPSQYDQIAETFRPGYLYRGKLLRAQEVVVYVE